MQPDIWLRIRYPAFKERICHSGVAAPLEGLREAVRGRGALIESRTRVRS